MPLPQQKWYSVIRNGAGYLAESSIFSYARQLFLENCQNWSLPLSKPQKAYINTYLILKDFSQGLFPPTFDDQAKVYQAEIDYYTTISGGDKEAVLTADLLKPFWGPTAFKKYANDFVILLQMLQQLQLPVGSQLLELGCGTGWMAAFLAKTGYHVVATSIAPDEIEIAQRHATALQVASVPIIPKYLIAAMETVDEAVVEALPFDAVFVYEALHHAFNWRKTIHAVYRCLKPGGYFIICNEPNLIHTFISYRVARLANTHEIGMNRRTIIQECRRAGFCQTRVLRHRWDNLISPHWIAARK